MANVPQIEPIDFWFSIGSTYTYLSVMRLPEVERREGVRFEWRPFNVRKIMIEMNNRPFVGKPAKEAYMWRDLERRAARYGLPIRVPPPYPLKELERANRAAVLGAAEGWCRDYVRASYRRWMQEGLEPGIEPNLSASLSEAGQDPARVLPLIDAEAAQSALDAATDAARALGIFGAPTFAVGREIFWGDERLEDALAWRSGGLRARAG
jgi:2-hydroxychromene-2-carboxylate isomerase